ncbi:hypothetical protein [[Clostridium] scindens]|uniref:hypothetical protein n=1 Tax=Clostridium scindens (strain JCM 10418 / VPI 12708) TaxID=29347 RepID=UPI0026756170|nr:hypothetical protein [[Clostridium] scindens]
MPEKMKELEKACEEMRELEKACESVIEYLNQNHDPHTYVVISQDSIKLQKVQISIPVEGGEAQEAMEMNSKEAFGIEDRLLGKISEAIDSGRKFTEREQKIYRAFLAMQDLRLYLEEAERNEGRQAEDL